MLWLLAGGSPSYWSGQNCFCHQERMTSISCNAFLSMQCTRHIWKTYGNSACRAPMGHMSNIFRRRHRLWKELWRYVEKLVCCIWNKKIEIRDLSSVDWFIKASLINFLHWWFFAVEKSKGYPIMLCSRKLERWSECFSIVYILGNCSHKSYTKLTSN